MDTPLHRWSLRLPHLQGRRSFGLPRDIRRSISRRAQEVAQGKTQAVIDHGGGVFSFKVGSDIVVYVSVQTGVRVTIEHIIG